MPAPTGLCSREESFNASTWTAAAPSPRAPAVPSAPSPTLPNPPVPSPIPPNPPDLLPIRPIRPAPPPSRPTSPQRHRLGAAAPPLRARPHFVQPGQLRGGTAPPRLNRLQINVNI